MIFPLVLVTAVVLAVVDCATLGRKSKFQSHSNGDGYCVPDEHECHFSYMRKYKGMMLKHHTYIPKDWHKCTEKEECRTTKGKNWGNKRGNNELCGLWERCKQHQGLQSPVNLKLRRAKYENFNPRYVNGRDIPGNFTNNGHSPTFTVEGKGEDLSKSVILRGVPDKEDSDYVFYELHFHIGKKSKKQIGSEHSMNNQFHDGEIHFVHWKRDHETQTLGAAAEAEDGLVAIGVFFDVDDSSHGNTYVDELIQNYVKNIKELYRCIAVNVNPELVLPKKGCMYSYAGSKTTPPCMETVRFLIYSRSIKISRESYNILATLETSDGPTGHSLLSDYGNRRPIQRRPVNDLITNCCNSGKEDDDNDTNEHEENDNGNGCDDNGKEDGDNGKEDDDNGKQKNGNEKNGRERKGNEVDDNGHNDN